MLVSVFILLMMLSLFCIVSTSYKFAQYRSGSSIEILNLHLESALIDRFLSIINSPHSKTRIVRDMMELTKSYLNLDGLLIYNTNNNSSIGNVNNSASEKLLSYVKNNIDIVGYKYIQEGNLENTNFLFTRIDDDRVVIFLEKPYDTVNQSDRDLVNTKVVTMLSIVCNKIV